MTLSFNVCNSCKTCSLISISTVSLCLSAKRSCKSFTSSSRSCNDDLYLAHDCNNFHLIRQLDCFICASHPSLLEHYHIYQDLTIVFILFLAEMMHHLLEFIQNGHRSIVVHLSCTYEPISKFGLKDLKWLDIRFPWPIFLFQLYLL